MQRITRYPLLIKKILQYTDEEHLDHLLLSEALTSAEGFLDRINESIRRGETKQQLEEIQRKLGSDNPHGLILANKTKYLGARQLLHQGPIRKAKSGRKLHMYLCNDLILLFSPGRTQGTLTRAYSSQSLSGSSPSSQSVQPNSSDWVLYHAPIALENVKIRVDQNDNLKFSIIINNPVSPSVAAHINQVPPHLQSSQQYQMNQGMLQDVIQVKAASAKDRKSWTNIMDKAIEKLAKAPRGYGMRTSVRPPLSDTIGTATIRANEAIIPIREFSKSKLYSCTVSLDGQIFTTNAISSESALSGMFFVLWKESVIFAITDFEQVLDVKIMSISPFSPDVHMGSVQIPFHAVIPYGERGTEVIQTLDSDIQIKFYMSYKAL
ncbi:hypothetical protein BGZ76_001808 [Entomortierella beljakovae]|nr:hypothetical protein BGZ76_001808 [Entomortierella beljakovae]